MSMDKWKAASGQASHHLQDAATDSTSAWGRKVAAAAMITQSIDGKNEDGWAVPQQTLNFSNDWKSFEWNGIKMVPADGAETQHTCQKRWRTKRMQATAEKAICCVSNVLRWRSGPESQAVRSKSMKIHLLITALIARAPPRLFCDPIKVVHGDYV